MDAQALTFADTSFDVVVSRNLTWNLQEPAVAYKEWCRVLKKGGLLLNFDANWYGYLFDEKKRQAYEEDRKNTQELGVEDHYVGTDIDAMERSEMGWGCFKRSGCAEREQQAGYRQHAPIRSGTDQLCGDADFYGAG